MNAATMAAVSDDHRPQHLDQEQLERGASLPHHGLRTPADGLSHGGETDRCGLRYEATVWAGGSLRGHRLSALRAGDESHASSSLPDPGAAATLRYARGPGMRRPASPVLSARRVAVPFPEPVDELRLRVICRAAGAGDRGAVLPQPARACPPADVLRHAAPRARARPDRAGPRIPGVPAALVHADGRDPVAGPGGAAARSRRGPGRSSVAARGGGRGWSEGWRSGRWCCSG